VPDPSVPQIVLSDEWVEEIRSRLPEMPGQKVERFTKEFGFKQASDTVELEALVDQVLEANPSAVNDYKAGTAKAMGFLIGQAMQASKGKANPKLIGEILGSKLK